MIINKDIESLYNNVFKKIYEVVAIVDSDEETYEIIHSIDDGAYSMLPKINTIEFLVSKIDMFIHKEDAYKVEKFMNIENLKSYFEKDHTELSFEFRSLKNDGKYRRCSVIIIPIENENKIKRYFYLSRTLYEKNIEILSDIMKNERDSLTSVYTKEAFYEHVENILRNNKEGKFGLIRFDIDKFKMINDAYSEKFGDITLRYLGINIRENIENKEYYRIGRLGGDVFAILYPYSEENTQNLINDIEKIVNNFEMSFFLSYGIYIVEDNSMSPIMICDRAHLAQKEVKGDTINRIGYYDEQIRSKYIYEAQITSAMYKALKNEEFKIYIQPKYSLESQKPIGAEALVRWLNPFDEIIPPYRFIPFFEKNNFIIKLDEYIWDKTCELIKTLNDEINIKIPLSVNVSRNNISNPHFVDTIYNITKKYNIDPNLLHIEITESAFTENQKLLNDTIYRLREYNFYVEIDDFGSGYSSLNVLKDIDVDAIKLDMCFLRGEYLTDKAKSILTSIIKMGKLLKLSIIQEGIENEEHLNFVKEAGCDIGQGYYFEKPMPIEDFIKYLKKYY